MNVEFLQENWFDLIQSLFIGGSFLLAAASFRNERRARQISHLLTLQQNRKNVWEPLLTQSELARIRQKEVNLEKNPITLQERIMVKRVIAHLYSVYESMKTKQIPHPVGIEEDIRQFFSLPIPRAVWEEVKTFQPKGFFYFIEIGGRLP